MSVKRIYVEKKAPYAAEAEQLLLGDPRIFWHIKSLHRFAVAQPL